MIDRKAAARAIDDFLRALGHEPVGDLEGTGERVADAWADDLLEGESIDPREILLEGSIDADATGSGLVLVRNLAVNTMCPHHLLPAWGAGLVGYLPGPRVAGIGTIAHVLDVVSRRLTLQETIGHQVVELIVEQLGARGAFCRLELRHACLVTRGERKADAVVETLAMGGSFAVPGGDRDLAIAALGWRS